MGSRRGSTDSGGSRPSTSEPPTLLLPCASRLYTSPWLTAAVFVRAATRRHSIRIPAIISWASARSSQGAAAAQAQALALPPGSRCGRVTSALDISATMLDALGLPPLPSSAGRSLMPVLHAEDGAAAHWDDVAFAEFVGEGMGGPPAPYTQRMVRVGDWKLSYYHGYAPQPFTLHNLLTDPAEQHDRASVGGAVLPPPPPVIVEEAVNPVKSPVCAFFLKIQKRENKEETVVSRTQRAKRWSGSSRRGSSVSVWPHAFSPSLGSDWRPCLWAAVPNVRPTPAPTTPVLHDVFTINFV